MRRSADITVVIPAYNRASELVRCLDSIAGQSVQPACVIVVDDGSTDNTVEVARKHRLSPTVLLSEHGGATVARNLGLQAVRTTWTMFFDSDDIMLPDHIESAARAINPHTDLIGWDVTAVDLNGKKHVRPFEPRDIVWHNIMHGTLATQRYMARTELFRRAGGWNPEVKIWNDIELGTRLLELAPAITKIKGTHVCVYSTGVSITGKSWSSNLSRYKNTLQILESNLGEGYAKILALKTAILAADIARENAAEGRRLYRSIKNKTFAVRMAYHYRRAGGRGAARLLRPFFSIVDPYSPVNR